MYSLFIDTHSAMIRICLFNDDDIVCLKEKESLMHHSDYLMPLIEEVLNTSNVSKKDLKEILVINGPGSFTGVRLGVTVAKMLAYTLNIEIKTMTSLDMFAYSNLNPKKLVSIKDVKGSYGAFYDNDLCDGPFYKSNSEYEEYLKDKQDFLIENKVDYNLVKKRFNDIKPTMVHIVNPIYIKVIEALK